MTTYKIPIELTSTGRYTISELKEKLLAYAQTLVNLPQEQVTGTEASTDEHTAWVQKMAKYRILEPKDDKEALAEALDEKYK